MRGQAWEANGDCAMLIHKPDEPAVYRDDDIRVSLTYGASRFKAFISPARIDDCVVGWQRFMDSDAAPAVDRDPRELTRKRSTVH